MPQLCPQKLQPCDRYIGVLLAIIIVIWSDNHPLETIYPLLRQFPYTATANYLDRKVAQSLEKKNWDFTTGIKSILELVSFV